MRLPARCLPILLAFLHLALSAQLVSSQCELVQVVGSAASSKDKTGWRVALHNTTGVMGSPFDDPVATDSGSAYVVERQGASWIETAYLVPGDGADNDQFGYAVGVTGDVVVVGAPMDDDFGFDSGSAYVFERGPTGWTETAKLYASDAEPFDWFGNAIACEGGTCVVGARSAGAAYVFESQGGAWVETARLVTGQKGGSVAIHGAVIVVGAPQNSAAHVFEMLGSTWTFTQKLIPSDAGGEFGEAVAVSDDRILVGAHGDDDATINAGSAYLFERQGSSWVEIAKLLASDPSPSAGFGRSVAIQGRDALIGVPGAGGTGAVYHYQETSAGWVEVDRLYASDGALGSKLGISVSLSEGTALSGAYDHDYPELDAGAVYLHSLYLCADVDAIPLSTGGAQTLSLTAGPAHAGDVHLVLGSFTGTAGFDLGGFLVPLDVDLYFLHTLAHPNAPPLAGSLGFLDGAGAAAATFTLPAGLPSSLAGATFYHACGVLDPGTIALEMVSAPVAVSLVP